MSIHTFTPCDLKSPSETIFCPMFKEQGVWFRDELFTTLEEAKAKNEFRIGHAKKFGLPEPELRIVMATYQVIP